MDARHRVLLLPGSVLPADQHGAAVIPAGGEAARTGHYEGATYYNRPVVKRSHYGWLIVSVTFVTLITTAGFRATPGVLIIPLQDEFHWSRSTISLANCARARSARCCWARRCAKTACCG